MASRGRVAYTPDNLGPYDVAASKFITDHTGVKVSGKQVRAVLVGHKAFVASDDYQTSREEFAAAKEAAKGSAKQQRREKLEAQLAALESDETPAPRKRTPRVKRRTKPKTAGRKVTF